MTDYFAVFGEPRRPWLEEERLKEKFHQLSLLCHPDTLHGKAEEAGSSNDFAELNEAYQVLRDPKQRLQHLLLLEGVETREAGKSIPGQLADLFWEVGISCRKLDESLAKYKTTESSLSRALLNTNLLETEKEGAAMLSRLTASYDLALKSLRELDATWQGHQPARLELLATLYQSISYLARWIAQLQERLFQVGSL